MILEKSKVNNVRVVGDEEAKQRNLDISAQVCGCVVRVGEDVVREGVCGYRGRQADVWMCDVHFYLLLHFYRYLLTSLVGSQQSRMPK